MDCKLLLSFSAPMETLNINNTGKWLPFLFRGYSQPRVGNPVVLCTSPSMAGKFISGSTFSRPQFVFWVPLQTFKVCVLFSDRSSSQMAGWNILVLSNIYRRHSFPSLHIKLNIFKNHLPSSYYVYPRVYSIYPALESYLGQNQFLQWRGDQRYKEASIYQNFMWIKKIVSK